MARGRRSTLENDSYETASSDYFGSLMVRKNGKQPAQTPYSHVDTSSEDSDDSQVFTTPSTSSYLSESPPMHSSFPPTTRRVTASASGTRHAPLARDYAPSTPGDTRHPNTNCAESSTVTPTDSDDLDLYSIAGLPILDTSLPPSELPDDLIVHDAHDLPYPVRYVRVTPLAKGPRLYAVPARDPSLPDPPRRVAQLHLANDNHIHGGEGHSAVFRAPLTLSVAAGSEVATRVRVVAKTPAPVCGSHRQLHREARMYHAFPRELAEGSAQPQGECDAAPSEGVQKQKRKMSWREQFSRFKLRRTPRNSKSEEKRPTVQVGTLEAPTPAVDSPVSVSHPCAGEVPVPPHNSRSREVPPVVPKFFGYYLLLKPDGQVFFELSEGHGECGEDGTCAVAWPPAILLIEDCGAPISIQPSRFTDAQRWECYRLLDGLHSAGFVAGQGQHARAASEWTGKMLVQPGPLGVPREARSYASPSFRLVDFGRAQCRQAGFEERWQEWCDHDLDGAFDALQLDHRAS